MGAKSTRDISRSQALHFIETYLPAASDETLARLVEELNDQLYEQGDFMYSLGLCNFRITPGE